MHKAGANYSYVRDEHCCFDMASGAASVPLYLLFSAANADHVVGSNSSFQIGGQRYVHHSIECYGSSNPTLDSVPLDIYWSAERKDAWTLASNASRAEATALGYVYIETTAHVPASCY
jgi:hypothetical protein